MPFRDDDEAARARADALQVDLDRTRDKLDEAEDEAAAGKRKLAETEARLRAAESRLAEKGETPPAPAPPPAYGELGPGARLFIGLGVVGLIGLIGYAVTRSKSQEASEPPNPDCTLRTDPAGAEIFSLCHDETMARVNLGLADAGVMTLPSTFEMRRGTTPLTQSRQQWIMDGVICSGAMVARYPGLPDTPVSAPLAGMGCTDEVIHLGAEK